MSRPAAVAPEAPSNERKESAAGVNDIDPLLNQHVTAAIFFHNPVFLLPFHAGSLVDRSLTRR